MFFDIIWSQAMRWLVLLFSILLAFPAQAEVLVFDKVSIDMPDTWRVVRQLSVGERFTVILSQRGVPEIGNSESNVEPNMLTLVFTSRQGKSINELVQMTVSRSKEARRNIEIAEIAETYFLAKTIVPFHAMPIILIGKIDLESDDYLICTCLGNYAEVKELFSRLTFANPKLALSLK